MSTEIPRNVTGLKLPVLAMVSKQVRVEALPILFKECDFFVIIEANFGDMGTLNAEAASDGTRSEDLIIRALRARHDQGARLQTGTKHLMARLARESVKVAFRSIEVCVLRPEVCLEPWRAPRAEKIDTSLRIRVPTATSLRPVISYDTTGDYRNGGRALVRDRVKAKLEEIAASRKGFVGYTLNDLRDVAKDCQYWPQGLPVP